MGNLFTYKQFGVFLLSFALFIHSFNRLLIISDYYLDTESYAANCENKANIELHCNGICQMNKKLKQETDKDKNNPERRVENYNYFYIIEPQPNKVSIISFHSPKQKFATLPDPAILDRPHDIFKPPTV